MIYSRIIGSLYEKALFSCENKFTKNGISMNQNIRIGNKQIGCENPCFIVAELGVNHNGDMTIAKKSIDKIAISGADAVKVQTWKTENIIQKDCAMVEYQKQNIGYEEPQYDMLKKLELPYEWHEELRDYAVNQGLVFFSTMEDRESVDFLVNTIKIPLIKVGSGDLTNYPLLRYTARHHIPMVLSTGMSTLNELTRAVDTIKKEHNDSLILLQCTTAYPAQYDEINLLAMLAIKERFGTIVGFSDHSLGDECAIAAVALGAKYLEKHFTLDRNLPGPDHKASLEPDEFKRMVTAIRNVEKALGSSDKKPTPAELVMKTRVCRRIVASKDIESGETISEGNIVLKRANEGINAEDIDSVIGKISKVKITKDSPVNFEELVNGP
jgi:N-acetylneuraminate synthase